MPTRSLNVVISGDARPLDAASKQASRSLDQIGGAHKKAAKATDEHIGATGRLRTSFGNLYAHGGEAILAVAGLEGIKKGVESVVEAYKTQEVSNSALKAQMKALNQSYSAHKDAIEEVVKRTSHLSGIAVPELTSTFTVLDRATGNVHKSLGLVGTAADVASAKHISASKAAVLLGKVADGNVTAFNRYGLSIKAGTSATDALHQIQKRFAGQAKAYGDTAAGAGDKLKSSWEEVRATLGSKVAPAIAGVERGVANFITGMQEGTGAGGAFAKAISTAFNFVKSTIQTVVKAVRGYLNTHKQDVQSVVDAFKRLGSFAKQAWQDILLPIIKRTVAAIGPIISGLVGVIRGLVRVVSGLLSGDWGKAWSGAKEVVGGAWKVIKAVVKTGIGDLWDLIKGIGPKVISLIVKGLEGLGKALITGILDGIKAAAKAVPGLAAGALKGIGHAVTSGISKGFGALNPFGDGIGRGDMGALIPSLGGFSGGLHGARPAMAPFAAIGSRFGLHVSSGRDDHSVMTSSGNVSYHSTGEAIDEAGSPAGMMGYFRYLKSHFGGRLAELIYGPGQVGIKDGRPYNFGPALNAQHMDHVHVAFDTGRPGVGDGPGRTRARTGDGIGQIENLWMRAGGNRSAAAMAAAIAMAESSGQPGVSHRNSDGSIDRGLWQINSVHGSQSTFDPLGNARAAVQISSGGSNWSPWTTYTSGAYRRFLGPAQAALGSGSSGGSSGGGSSSGGGASGPHTMYPVGSTHTVTIKPTGQSTYRAPANPFGDQYVATDFANRQSAVRGRSGPAKGNAIRKGNTSDQQAALQAARDNAPTELDYLNMALSQAGLTADTGDDKAALKNIADYRFRAYQGALAGGDPRAIGQAADDLKSATDALGAFQDTAKALTDALNGVKASIDAQTAFATSVSNTSNYQLTKMLSDLISGHIVGSGVAGRAYTPGTGVEVSY